VDNKKIGDYFDKLSTRKMKMKWKRLKKGLAKKKDESAYKQAKEEIEGFEKQAKKEK